MDADGRTNKFPTEFSIVVLPDRPPEVKVIFPHGDQRVSSLEELELEGEAKAEFGLLKYGIGYSVAGQEPQFVDTRTGVPADRATPVHQPAHHGKSGRDGGPGGFLFCLGG